MEPLLSQQLTLPVVEVFLGIEEQILTNIAEYLKREDRLLEDDINAWQVQQLSMLEQLTQENMVAIAEEAGVSLDAIVEMLEAAGFTAIDDIEMDLQDAAEAGKLLTPKTVEESQVLRNVILAYAAGAQDTFNLVNSTMLTQSRQIYLDIINQTVGKVLAGVTTPRQALAETAAKWAAQGVPALIDKAGRKWSTEAYVNAVTRSMVNNVAHDMQEARMDEYGCDLVEISSHAGARPKCAAHQGKIYSRSGKSRKYPSLKNTSIGKPDGLFGINCRHKMYPYIEGITRKTYRIYPHAENKRIYAESQKQRYLEREIRKAKRELQMLEAVGNEELIQSAKARVREKQANMRAFIDETERTRRYDREQPY